VGATPLDIEAFEYLEASGCAPIVVATKSDKVPRGRRMAQLARIAAALEMPDGERVVAVSARTGEGIQELWRRIEEALGPEARERTAH
jgi:GTP-binding protein